MAVPGDLAKLRFHPLQIERMELESNHKKKRKEMDEEFKLALKAVQDKCTHHWEDGRCAKDYTSPPFNETFCAICQKTDW